MSHTSHYLPPPLPIRHSGINKNWMSAGIFSAIIVELVHKTGRGMHLTFNQIICRAMMDPWPMAIQHGLIQPMGRLAWELQMQPMEKLKSVFCIYFYNIENSYV